MYLADEPYLEVLGLGGDKQSIGVMIAATLYVKVFEEHLRLDAKGTFTREVLDMSSTLRAPVSNAFGVPGLTAMLAARMTKPMDGPPKFVFCGSLSLEGEPMEDVGQPENMEVTLDSCSAGKGQLTVKGVMEGTCSRLGAQLDGVAVSKLLQKLSPTLMEAMEKFIEVGGASVLYSTDECITVPATSPEVSPFLPKGAAAGLGDIDPGFVLLASYKAKEGLSKLAGIKGPAKGTQGWVSFHARPSEDRYTVSIVAPFGLNLKELTPTGMQVQP